MLYAAFFQDQPIAPTDQVTCPQRVFCVAMATQKYGIGRKGVKMLWLAEVRPRPNSLVRRTTSRRSVPMMRMPDVTDFRRDLHKPLCQPLCGKMPFGLSCGPLWQGSGQTLANRTLANATSCCASKRTQRSPHQPQALCRLLRTRPAGRRTALRRKDDCARQGAKDVAMTGFCPS